MKGARLPVFKVFWSFIILELKPRKIGGLYFSPTDPHQTRLVILIARWIRTHQRERWIGFGTPKAGTKRKGAFSPK
ncbi:MAG: hypothetical protein COA46_00400 [Porticoccaceae bacterium]|nr:MAG: hypothetical protein COA46_00400 [Porticoccaceae bacterium]